MSARRWWVRSVPWLRAALVAAAGAGLVLAATTVEEPAAWRWVPAQEQGLNLATGPSLDLVADATLTCPGPPTRGLADATIEESALPVVAVADTAPLDALSGLPAPRGSGQLTLQDAAGLRQDGAQSSAERGEQLSLESDEATAPTAVASGALAPGATAAQWSLGEEAGSLGLTIAPCAPGATESWLLAGGPEPGRLERLVMVNPGPDPILVSATVHGADGPLPSTGGQDIALAGYARTVLLLDALAPGEASPAVQVRSSGGPVVAALADRWLDGTIDRGVEVTGPAAPAATEVVVPGIVGDAVGEHGLRVRVVVPGGDPAVVQLRGMTDEGPVGLSGDVSVVGAGSSLDITLTDVPEGVHALQVSADVPVLAAGHVHSGDPEAEAPSDLTWLPGAEAISSIGGLPLPTGVELDSAVLTLAAPEGGTATVLLSDGSDVQRRDIDLAPASTQLIDVVGSSAVWVVAGGGQVHAALTLGVTVELPVPLAPGQEEPDPPVPVDLLSGSAVPQLPATRLVPAVLPLLP